MMRVCTPTDRSRRKVRTAIAALAAAAVLSFATTDKAEAIDFRLQGNAGYGTVVSAFGTGDQSIGPGVDAQLSDNLSGSGFSGGASFWVDKWLLSDNFTLGVEYLYNKADNDSSVGTTATGNIDQNTDVDFHTFFLNAAYRLNEEGNKWHPYIGGGVGGGWVQIRINDDLFGKEDFGSPHLGVGAFFGFDYDVTENIYLGTQAKFYYINADIIDEDVEAGLFSLLATFGYKF